MYRIFPISFCPHVSIICISFSRYTYVAVPSLLMNTHSTYTTSILRRYAAVGSKSCGKIVGYRKFVANIIIMYLISIL